MYPIYKDIREGMGTPLWIDRNGVPRYSEFTPQDAAEIYGDWVALLTVECQSCQKTFQCTTSLAYWQVAIKRLNETDKTIENTPEAMLPLLICWGDAPWHDTEGNECGFDDQCSGTTMTTSIRWAKAWRKVGFDWVEVDVLPGDIDA